MNTVDPPRAPDLEDALTELAGLLLATPSVDQLLGDLARLASGVLTTPVVCGITLDQDSLPMTVASGGPLASHLDEVQYGADDGPCLEAMRTGRRVEAVDFATERRWGSYPAHAVSYGARSSLSMPLSVNGRSRGALNLYAVEPHAFDDESERRAAMYSAQVAALLTVAVRQSEQVQLTEQLREALASRAVIDQALGILMAQEQTTHDTAFALLRSSSQHQNRKLRDIATDIVRAVSGQDPEPGSFGVRSADAGSS